VMVWAAVLWDSILFVPLLLPLMAHLLQGSMWIGWVIRCIHRMMQMLFPNNDAVLQDDSACIHTARTVQSSFEDHEGDLQPPGQHNHQICTSLNYFGQFL
jgi:hypothetical protein